MGGYHSKSRGGGHPVRSWKLKINSSKAEKVNDFNIAVNSFIHELKRLPDVSHERSMIEHHHPHKDPLKPYLLTSEHDTLRKGHNFFMWTQGPVLYFKQGDYFPSRIDDSLSIQVQYSDTMGWDPTINGVHEGLVNFNVYKRAPDGATNLISRHVCSQYEFLKILINGDISANTKASALRKKLS